MKPAVTYQRVSSEEQAKEGHSIEAQDALNVEYAQRHGLNIVQAFTEARTAKQSGREQFLAMVAWVKKQKKPVALIVEKTDRLYRNFKDFIVIDELINSHNLEVHLAKEGEVLGQNASSHTKLIHGIKVVLAKNYVDNLSEETQKGMMQKVLKGGWPGPAPYGYKNYQKQIVVDDDTAEFVRQVFRLYGTSLYSLERLREELFTSGHIYRPSQQRITRSGLHNMLNSRVYIGEVEYKGEIYPGTHPPLITIEEWIEAQRALRKDNKPESAGRRTFQYGQILTCGECGAQVVGEEKKGGKYTYYRCCAKKKGCSQGYVNQDKIDQAIDEMIFSLGFSEESQKAILETVKGFEGALDGSINDEKSKVEAKLKRYRNNLRKAYQDRLEGLIDEDMFATISQEFNDTIKSLESRRAKVEAADIDYYQLARIMVELPKKMSTAWFRASTNERRRILNWIGSNYALQNGKLLYELKEPFCYMVQKGSCQDWYPVENVVRILRQNSETLLNTVKFLKAA